VVAGGLYLSYRSHEFLQPRSRVQASGVWWTLGFLLNGVVFILIGLQLPVVVKELGDVSLQKAIGYGLAVSALVIVVRIGWTFVSAFVMRLSPARRRAQPTPPDPRAVFLIAWAGMRGVVSLASALAIPLVARGRAFPERELLVFVTFVVILCTLVLQGLSLPRIIRWLRFEQQGETAREQHDRLEMLLARATVAHLRAEFARECAELPAFARMLEHYEEIGRQEGSLFGAGHGAYGADEAAARYREALRTIAVVQRAELLRVRHEGAIEYEITQAREDKLDLEAARLEIAQH
jgi:CPA1 family monovalent cation:H+ antiporter